MNLNYNDFIASKAITDVETGFKPSIFNEKLMPFQKDIASWACRRGRAAIFADCGTGKTIMQLVWALNVCEHTGGNVMILAPLAVSSQTVHEGMKFGIHVNRCLEENDVMPGINITNYERIEKFDLSRFSGIVCDESSIMKNYAGKYRNEIINRTASIPYRLACTATPAPNDYEEIGNHAQFLGVMTRTEMLATFFTHDGGDTAKWRLRKHGQEKFWIWLASWSVMFSSPSDIGYDNDGFILPELVVNEHIVKVGRPIPGMLFVEPASTLQERQSARRDSTRERCEKAAQIANAVDGPVVAWCNLNTESAMLTKMIHGAVEVKGSDSPEHKEKALTGFSEGKIRALVTKPTIAGFGMNWQHCGDTVYVGLSDSWEQWYQSVRRFWRFGRTAPVNAHIVIADTEGAVLENIKRKETDAQNMRKEMVRHMSDITKENIHSTKRVLADYERKAESGEKWTLHLGDCVDVYREIESDSIGYTIFSPPFSSLYVYSNSDRDMGNCKSNGEFFEHFSYLVNELYRVTMPGRAVSFHCMNIPIMKERDGYIGLSDFRGDLIRLFMSKGFIFHSEHCIWKDPLIEATRTKAIGLMHKQLCKDSAMCRSGIPDYLVTMRKPGTNPRQIIHPNGIEQFEGLGDVPQGVFSHNAWRKLASPVWMDINQTRTLQYQTARDNNDERHICPLQLDVIERGLMLWSAQDDLVSSPFAGIGSELYCAVKMGRRAVGSELKRSYWDVAVKNLKWVEKESRQLSLF